MTDDQQGGTATVATPPPSTPPPRAPRPVLWRTSTDKVLGGVAGGLARTFAMDPVVVRIIVVVICIAFPPALVAYLAAWLLVARDDRTSSTTVANVAVREPGGLLFWVGVVALVGLAAAAFEGTLGGGYGLLPLLLIGIGVALWTRDGQPTGSEAVPPAGTWPAGSPEPNGDTATVDDPGRDTDGDAVVEQPAVAAPGSPTTHPLPTAPPPEPLPPRPRSPLGAITVAVALITTGVVAALDMVEGVPLDADPTHLAAVALLVLGLGQLVGALWGRARWLTVVALLLLPPVLAGAAFRELAPRVALAEGLDLGDGIGERAFDPVGPAALPEEVRLLAGQATVDLLQWEPTDAAALDELAADDSDLTVSVGAGEVVLAMPPGVPWRVLGDVGLGEITVSRNGDVLERETTQSTDQSLQVLRSGGPQDGPVLDVVVDLRVGELDVLTPPFDDDAWQALRDDLTSQELS